VLGTAAAGGAAGRADEPGLGPDGAADRPHICHRSAGLRLGLAQLTAEGLGRVWFYEGGTLGFRTLHVYVPESGLIMAMGLNSAPAEDRIDVLLMSVYSTLIAQGVVPAPRVAVGAPAA
jgi:hypothetical protein